MTNTSIRALRCAIGLAIAATLPAHALDHVGYEAQRGDPDRWYQPADTPQRKYETAMKEARNALAEARKECRGQAKDARKACEAEARAQYARDVADAKAYLAGRRPLD